MKYDVWRKNVVRIVEEAKCRQLIVMMTINSLCLFSITEFLDDMISLKKKYGQYKVVVDLNILRWPAFMSPVTLPDHLKKLAQQLGALHANSLVVLTSKVDEKANVVLAISESLVNQKNWQAPQIIKEKIAPLIKGGGGGQKGLATAGGKDPSNLTQVIESVKNLLN